MVNVDFPRILTLLRKEKGISQKEASSKLGISQALLSHYEKGIRECGLEFLVRCADFYGVSCDYLLGRSPDRLGSQLTVEDIPEPDASGKENTFRGGVLPVLNKKLISNSLNILFDLLGKSHSEKLVREVSDFLMLSVYRMFRVVFSINQKNQAAMFTVPEKLSHRYSDAVMQMCEARAAEIAAGKLSTQVEQLEEPENLLITTESLTKSYPLFASSLLNLVRNSEKTIDSSCSRQ